MLVVISDLHFQDTTSYALHQGPRPEDRRNVDTDAFRLFFKNLGSLAERLSSKARKRKEKWHGKIDVVLAGDIIELNRSLRWFGEDTSGPPVRPYADHPVEMGSPLDERVAKIYKVISEDANQETFELFAEILTWQDSPWNKVFPPETRFQYHFIPGNHDRLANLCPTLNTELRKDFRIEPIGKFVPFPHLIRFPQYATFVRHGHEYDPDNCEFRIGREHPAGLPDSDLYNRTPFGDFMTTEFAANLVFTYHRLSVEGRFGKIRPGTKLYDRAIGLLQAFDDVRPQANVFKWLKQYGTGGDERDLWPSLRMTLRTVAKSLGECDAFTTWLEAKDRAWVPERIDLIQAALKLPGDIVVWLAEMLKLFGAASEELNHEDMVKDPVWEDPRYLYFAVGHKHESQNAPLLSRDDHASVPGERHVHRALCSGTWRSRYTQCLHDGSFSPSQTMNYLLFYDADEARDDSGTTVPVLAQADTVHMQRYTARGTPELKGRERLKVRFSEIEVVDDCDYLGSGDLCFEGRVNDLSTGVRGPFEWSEDEYPIDWEVEALVRKIQSLTVTFEGFDEDWHSADDSLGRVKLRYPPKMWKKWKKPKVLPGVVRREKKVVSSNGRMKVSFEIIALPME